MKIVADENLKYVEQLFSDYGKLCLLPGREIDANAVADAEVLLVRSVTKVDETLLAGSQIKFVGSATSGVEHVDQNYLERRGIGFAHAKGSNATAVAEYCLASLCLAHEAGCFDFENDRVGLVGCGHVGSTLALLLRKLDIAVSVFDPFLSLERSEQLARAGIELGDLAGMFDCAAVSLHVPLTREGRFATANMVNESLLTRLGSSCTFMNASRGGVVNERALLNCLQANPNIFAALDVWEGEPDINTELFARANVATPHMAGYSRSAKARATQMLATHYRKKYLNLKSDLPIDKPLSREEISGAGNLIGVIKQAMPLDQLSADFKRQSADTSSNAVAEVFDSFRKSMINRAEFSDYTVDSSALSAAEIEQLRQLGFGVTNKLS